jgi:hypothetical protein
MSGRQFASSGMRSRSGNAGTAEQSHAGFDHLLKRIRRPILIGNARLRTHSRRWRPDRPDLEAMALHLSSEVGAGSDDDIMIGLPCSIHQRQHRIEVAVKRIGGEQDAHCRSILAKRVQLSCAEVEKGLTARSGMDPTARRERIHLSG